MNFLSKLIGRFSKKKAAAQSVAIEDKTDTAEKHPGMVRTCIQMPYRIIHPSEMSEELGIAVVKDTKACVAFNSDEICLFDMSTLDGEFIGSFYALKRNNLYYGNIVGHRDIIACETDAFKFVATEMLSVPVHLQGQTLYALLCRYKKENSSLAPVLWGTFNNGVLQDTLHEFPAKTSVREALDYCQSEAKKL